MTDLPARHFFSKLASGFAGALVNVVLQAFLPRTLGPGQYGNFMFLNSIFEQVVQFFDGGSSAAYYAKLSRRNGEVGIIYFYARVCLIFFLALLLLTAFVCLTKWHNEVFPGQIVPHILLAMLYAFLFWLVQVVQKTADAFHMTTFSELCMVLQKIVLLLALVLLFKRNMLELRMLYLAYITSFLSLILGMAFAFKKGRADLWQASPVQVGNARYAKEFMAYVKPLLLLSLVSLVCNIADRWLLQKCAGNVEQGFFSLSQQVSGVCVLFTAAVMPLLMRSVANKHHRGDASGQTEMVETILPLFFMTAAVISCFMSFHGRTVITMFGGSGFGDAHASFVVMSFYPIHQTVGQLCGSVYYACEQTRTYAKRSAMVNMLGLPLTYFLLAPGTAYGLDLGSVGLALKVVLVQLLGVHVLIFGLTSFMKCNVWNMLSGQIRCVLLILALAWLSSVVAMCLQSTGLSGLISMTGSALLYLVVLLIIFKLKPSWLGIPPDAAGKIQAWLGRWKSSV